MSEPSIRTTQSSHTGATVTNTEYSNQTSLGCDTVYLTSIQGLLKVSQMTFSFIAFMCVTCAPGWHISHWSAYQFFQFVSMTCLVLTSFQLFLICTKLIFRIPLPWNPMDVVYHAFAVGFYFLGSCLVAAWAINSSLGAGAAFGFFAFLAYGGGLYYAIMDYRRSLELRGGNPPNTISTTISTTTTVAGPSKTVIETPPMQPEY
ncbi:CKLF-like MARVEL transmembrane domain-containing protein 4 [Anneissia japonica]|uniref:CKLF-like MARVEL transmembrane domain-containing protein 4 n=1 Tax=Anneissia japonica TaxID=1529436 RepID=UPI00142559E8|nr:CKLF-like MARVEL transmembrane domain-containing protein 4 [Anneissia japonica]XP_033123741.1 CKLF-like MARVEL transmembrane domain-containing protein 4 [Anneissia japonica]XP_033123742.1 CKLF-like MARVEL transmembrane domain-containing protein 4 [Anneissia japonica]XP_033123743.1 CKLF-like MARVEL transmembrane domain-containing protein 4 [Anneissia japonica]